MEWTDGDPMGSDAFVDYADGEVARSVPGDLSVGSIIGEAWQFIRDRPVETIGGMLAVFGIMFGVQMVFTTAIYVVIFAAALIGAAMVEVLGETAGMVLMIAGGSVMYLLMLAVIVALQSLAMAAYQVMWLKIVRGQTEKINYAAVIKRFSLPIILGSLLHGAAVLAGSLALIIGMYIVILGLAVMPLLIVDWEMKPMEALKSSWSLMSGHKMEMFVLMLALGAINMVGLFACGMGMIVTVPMTWGGIAIFYNRLAREGNAYLRV